MLRNLCRTGVSAACASALLVGCGDGKPSVDPRWHSREGETLVARSNCLACHAADDATRERIRTVAAPKVLGGNGVASAAALRTPEYLRAFLLAPNDVRPGSRMPDALHGLAATEKAEVVEDLVHFLVAQAGDAAGHHPAAALPEEIARGKDLFRTAGCAVCHATLDSDAERSRLAKATSHAALAAFLRDPLATHPGGLMPDMHLTPEEAHAVAAYLLEKQASGGATKAPGLRASYFERPMSADGVPDDDLAATRVFVHPSLDFEFPRRNDEFALRLEGFVEIPASGRYTFHLGSDDGSRLAIDGKPLIDFGGVHGFGWKDASIDLDAGMHRIAVTYWEVTGDEQFEVEWEGPGIDRGPIPPSRLFHEAVALVPPASTFALDNERAARGGAAFAAHGCAQCHMGVPAKAKPLAELDPEKGCLAVAAPAGAPRFAFDDAARTSVRDVVAHASSLSSPLKPAFVVEHAMLRLNCVACHARGDLKPPREHDAFFVADGSAELGDQGRLPPSLNGVGDKFRPMALASQLADGTKVRPYMRTRMPSFGDAAIGDLASTFVKADLNPKHDGEVAFTAESSMAGRMLAGSTGVSCITCHTCNGRPSLGVPAIDLASMHERLRPGWFLAFLENPSEFTPGTRMMRFWLPNEKIFSEYCGGNAVKQREAIWNYLSLGDAMPLPPGLQSIAGQYELSPATEPIVFGTFMRDVSPRTICVGYPEFVHVAFDAQAGRLAKAWRGQFIDARGTWDGRAGQLESPLGKSVLEMADGPSFALLAARDQPWPSTPNAYRGMTRDAARRPGFALGVGDLTVVERPMPVLKSGGAWLRRAVEASATEDRTDLYVRAAVGRTIEREGDAFLVAGKRIVIDTPGAFVRTSGDLSELLVPVDFKYVEGSVPPYRATINIDVDW